VIVRILEEGQYEVAEADRGHLDELDAPLEHALEFDDPDAFTVALDIIGRWVRENGEPVGATTIVPSDLVLPAPGSHLSEVRALLNSEGEQH
jgi:hypothetical protein